MSVCVYMYYKDFVRREGLKMVDAVVQIAFLYLIFWRGIAQYIYMYCHQQCYGSFARKSVLSKKKGKNSSAPLAYY